MTLKQKLFVKEYLNNGGNGTGAAMSVYNTKDPNVAHSIAVDNLRSPTVKAEIQEALESVGLDLISISKLLKKATTSGLGQKATNSDSLRGIELMLKLQNAYPTQRTSHLRVNLRQELEKMTYQDLIKKHQETTKEIENILSD